MTTKKTTKATTKSHPAFEGMEKKNTLQKFIKFETEGQYFKGHFMGIKQVHSQEYGTDQTCWVCMMSETTCKDSQGLLVNKGDVVLIPEKATMESMRLELTEGVEFGLVYEGEKESSKKGRRPYKDFSLYI